MHRQRAPEESLVKDPLALLCQPAFCGAHKINTLVTEDDSLLSFETWQYVASAHTFDRRRMQSKRCVRLVSRYSIHSKPHLSLSSAAIEP
jgi:hypothetical protein